MSIDILKIEVEKRPARLRFDGRVLFLVDDAELIRRQLNGEDLELTGELRSKLRDQISTDEITPAYICYYFDETLGEFPYLGLRASGEFPVERGTVRKGGFVCSVSGKRRGKGSSREQSPYAELMAGIKVVIAENIERIYNENCQNLGVLTSTDFSLVDRIRDGEEIQLAEFTEGVDPITRDIIEYGGLFEYNVARLQGKVVVPSVSSGNAEERHGGVEPDLGDPAAVRDLRGAGEKDAGAVTYGLENAAAQTTATSRPTNERVPDASTADGSAPRARGVHADDATEAGSITRRQHRGMTIAEKIFASRWVVDAANGRFGVPAVQPGDSGFVRTDWRFSHEYVSPMAAIFFEHKLGPDAKVNDPSTILMFRDHLTYLHEVMPQERVQLGLLDVARQLKDKQEEFAKKQGVIYYGERLGIRLGSEAICHSKMLEEYAEPGQIIVGTDSHTPHSGAIGCIAFGIGTTAIFNSWITKDVRVSVPPSFKVIIRGRKPTNVTAKDFMLEILRHPYIRDGHAIGQIIEYAGEAVESLSIDERATMTNMAAEVGAFTGIVAPDAKAVEYLVSERGVDRAHAEQLMAGLRSDDDAEYVKIIEIDASTVRPMVALPGDPGNGLYIDELADEPIRLDVAYAGSCTAGKKEDMDMYAAVLKSAHDEGLRVHPDVKLFIQCGSQEVRQYCEERGYLKLFEEMGAEFIEPGCGACIAAGPGTSKTRDEVTISSQNRNFPGRSGPGQLYLASPYTVAASAVAGHIVEWEPGASIRQLQGA
ncbi:MAG TPA: aconitase family protein [Longimicrobiales bacterium]|nr:aconitase family protein [Longimicrobiales bacterium]